MTNSTPTGPRDSAKSPVTPIDTRLGLRPGLFPYASHFVRIEGADLHYVDEGEGPILFMLHGNPTWSFLYRHLIAALRARFRCIAIDLPGFGLSEIPVGYRFRPEDHARHVAQVIERLDISDGTLIAHDWGGPIGLSAALAQPGRFSRFVLGNTWAWPVNGDSHFEGFSRIMGGAIGRFGARQFNLFVNGVMPASMRRGRLPKEVMHAYRLPFRDKARREGTHLFPKEITGSRDFLHAIESRLGEFDGRHVLLLWPDADIAFREKELRRWQTIFPDACTQIIPNCGHYLWEEAPSETANAIESWCLGEKWKQSSSG